MINWSPNKLFGSHANSSIFSPICGGILSAKASMLLQNVPPALLVWKATGCRGILCHGLDFWLSQAQEGGVLSTQKGGGFFVAFSRDQPQKVFVQHKMKEKRKRIWNLLSEGAAIYIVGSSNNMPADVTSMLEEIVRKKAGFQRNQLLDG